MIICNTINDVLKEFYFKNINTTILASKLKDRFSYHLKLTKTFFVEDYIEREWRDIYSLHYSKTSYELPNKVKRVHLCKNNIKSYKELTNENYLGYFTIRPIPSETNFISRARLKILDSMYDITNNDLSIILKLRTKINILDKTLYINTFPYFVQDSIVNVCAHSDILMLTKYLYKKTNFSFVDTNKIYKILNQNQRQIPSKGLTIYEISNLLNNIGYNPLLYRFENFKLGDISIEEVIEAYIKSEVPILFAFKNHIVIITGIIYKNRNRNDIELIIYDDSTYFIKSFFGVDKQFTKNIPLKTIKRKIKECGKNCNYQYLIIPTMDRWYLRFEDIKDLVHNYIKPKIDKHNILEYEMQIVNNIILRKKFKNYQNKFTSHFYWTIKWVYKNNNKVAGFSFIDSTMHKFDKYTFNEMFFIEIEKLLRR